MGWSGSDQEKRERAKRLFLTDRTFLNFQSSEKGTEFVAFIAGMTAAKDTGIEFLGVEGDSKMIVNLMTGETTASAIHIVALYRTHGQGKKTHGQTVW